MDDYCYECQAYGDDYYINDAGALIFRCWTCPENADNWEDGHWIDED